jgi:3-oxoacyl-[acyl-carrier-protein] synthase II
MLFGRKDARRLSRSTQFALAAAGQAIQDAGLVVTDGNRDRIGVLVGSGMGSLDPVVENLETLGTRGASRVSPFFVPMMLADTPAAVISINFGLGGPNMSVATACATGNNALGEAARIIRSGAADVMLAGGTEASILPITIAGFAVMGALSLRNDDPQKAVRPFDAERDGFVPSEGAAVLVLEDLAHAQARSARIYAELLGYGTTADAYHISQPEANGQGAIRAIRAALADAAISPAAIDYVNAHGTGTPLNDAAETRAIKGALGDHAYRVAVSSTKSVHGHLLGAAGALEAAICLQVLAMNTLPPTINLDTPDPECDLDYVPHTARPATVSTILSNGFGFGGHNATIILGRFSENGN